MPFSPCRLIAHESPTHSMVGFRGLGYPVRLRPFEAQGVNDLLYLDTIAVRGPLWAPSL